jgi:CAAX protease family protein
VGFAEEIPFRGLLQTLLMQRTLGRVRILNFDMHIAGVILAMLFALARLTSFWGRSFWFALGQLVYAFAIAILYAYWREKSDSLLAPIIGHNVSDGVEYALMFLMTWLWR